MIVERIEVTGDLDDLAFAPTKTTIALPASYLSLEPGPVGRQLLIPPVNLRCVASDAMGAVEKLPQRFTRFGRRLSEQRPYDEKADDEQEYLCV